MNKIKILKAKPEDAEGSLEVYYQSWLATYPNKKYGITTNDIKYIYKDRHKKTKILEQQEKIKNHSKELLRFVAKDEKKVVGVCSIIVNKDKNQLKSIYLLPAYQGKGIGKLFWNNAKKTVNPKKKTIIQIATYNTKAINFYKKIGFSDTKKRFKDKKFRMKSGALSPEMEMLLKK